MSLGSSITCPKCGSTDHFVKDSRPSPNGRQHSFGPNIRRMRECASCEWRFATIEIMADEARKLQRTIDCAIELADAIADLEAVDPPVSGKALTLAKVG